MWFIGWCCPGFVVRVGWLVDRWLLMDACHPVVGVCSRSVQLDLAAVFGRGVRFVCRFPCCLRVVGGCETFTESLILAQDERWRRA